jgi:hypothetical protein
MVMACMHADGRASANEAYACVVLIVTMMVVVVVVGMQVLIHVLLRPPVDLERQAGGRLRSVRAIERPWGRSGGLLRRARLRLEGGIVAREAGNKPNPVPANAQRGRGGGGGGRWWLPEAVSCKGATLWGLRRPAADCDQGLPAASGRVGSGSRVPSVIGCRMSSWKGFIFISLRGRRTSYVIQRVTQNCALMVKMVKNESLLACTAGCALILHIRAAWFYLCARASEPGTSKSFCLRSVSPEPHFSIAFTDGNSRSQMRPAVSL